VNNIKLTFNNALRITVFVLAIIVTFLLTGNTRLPMGMEYFPLVPFVFGVGYLLSKKTSLYIFKNIGLLGLNLALIIRYVITPFFMWFNGHPIGRGTTPSPDNYKIAILLMILEIIVIFLTIEIFSRKFYKEDKQLHTKRKIKVNINFVGAMFLLTTFVIIIIYPVLLERYSFVLTASEYKKNIASNLPFGSLFPIMVSFSGLLLTVTILNEFYKKNEFKANPTWIYLSIFIVFLISSFITGTSRFSMVIPMVTGMYLITRLYPLYSKAIISISGILILTTVSISTLVKQYGITLGGINNNITNVTTSVSSSLQSYFSGVNNVATAVKAREVFRQDISFDLIASDLSSSVMLLGDKFSTNFGGVEMFNYAFYNNAISTDQILPMIGQGYLYFGCFFSPVFVIVFTYFMMYFDSKSRKGKSVFEVYIYSYIALRFGLFFMSNAIILTSFFTNSFLLLFFIIFLNNKFVLFDKEKSLI